MFSNINQSLRSATISFDDVEIDVDNLDDLLIEAQDYSGVLVVVDNEHLPAAKFSATPVNESRFAHQYIRRTKERKYKTKTQFVFPENEYTSAPTLVDWLDERSLCASEIPYTNGTFFVLEKAYA